MNYVPEDLYNLMLFFGGIFTILIIIVYEYRLRKLKKTGENPRGTLRSTLRSK